jgi:hypothetical protein
MAGLPTAVDARVGFAYFNTSQSLSGEATLHGANRPGVGAMAIRSHPVRAKAHGRFRGTEERLHRPHVALLAQHRVGQVAVQINRAIEVAPPATDLQLGLVNIPAGAGSAPGAVPPFAPRISQDRQQFRFPVSHRLMANDEPAEQKDFAQIPKRQPIAQTAENHKADDVAPAASLGKQVRFSTPSLRSLNCLPQSRQRNRW